MRKVTNFFVTNKQQDITKNQTAISNRSPISKNKTLAKLFLHTSCLMTLSKLLRAACKAVYLHRGKQQQINESLEPCNNHILKSSVFPDRFSNSEANEFLKYSFCKENYVDGMCKYIEHLDRQDLCRISLYPEQQNKQWPGFAGKQEKTSPESTHFCGLCIPLTEYHYRAIFIHHSLFVSI